MKLFLCPKCSDVLKMNYEWRYCDCKSSAGRYLSDGDFAEIFGDAIPIGILNSSVVKALQNSKKDACPLPDLDLKAFLFAKDYYKISKVKKITE